MTLGNWESCSHSPASSRRRRSLSIRSPGGVGSLTLRVSPAKLHLTSPKELLDVMCIAPLSLQVQRRRHTERRAGLAGRHLSPALIRRCLTSLVAWLVRRLRDPSRHSVTPPALCTSRETLKRKRREIEMSSHDWHVHRSALLAGATRATRHRRNSSRVIVTRVSDDVMTLARILADGNSSRIKILSTSAVIVRN